MNAVSFIIGMAVALPIVCFTFGFIFPDGSDNFRNRLCSGGGFALFTLIFEGAIALVIGIACAIAWLVGGAIE